LTQYQGSNGHSATSDVIVSFGPDSLLACSPKDSFLMSDFGKQLFAHIPLNMGPQHRVLKDCKSVTKKSTQIK
jgi:hypothetical protein